MMRSKRTLTLDEGNLVTINPAINEKVLRIALSWRCVDFSGTYRFFDTT